MSGRNVGFSTKEAVASIMGAFRDRHGVEGEEHTPIARIGIKVASTHLADLPSGHSVHELASESDLITETARWRLGAAEQSSLTRAKGHRALSIRSSVGNSEFILLVDATGPAVVSIITQIGMAQSIPNPCHVGRTLVAKGISIDQHLRRFAAMRDKEGKKHFVDDCPDKVELGADTYIHSSDPAVLPKVIVADGDFHLLDTEIGRNAVSANVRGSLGMRNVTGLTVPSHLNVGVDLCLQMSDADRLPMRFSIGRDLDIGLTPITEFPDTFHVGRNIIANGASITRLRGGLTVNGNLDLRDCPLKEVAWGLEVRGDLNLSGTNINAVPGDCAVGGNLMVEEGVVVPSTVRLGGKLMYARPYGYETVRRPSN